MQNYSRRQSSEEGPNWQGSGNSQKKESLASQINQRLESNRAQKDNGPALTELKEIITNDLQNYPTTSPTKDANYANEATQAPIDLLLFQQNGSGADLIERQKLVQIDASEP